MSYTRAQWEFALADLQRAAHGAGVTTEQTDSWAVRHDVVPESIGSALGRYDDAGAFRVISAVGSPHALRELASLYPNRAGAATMASMPGDVISVDGVPRVVTSAVRTTHRGAHGLSVAHVAPEDAQDPTAAANASVINVRDDDGESDDDTERAHWLPMGDAPDVRAMPV